MPKLTQLRSDVRVKVKSNERVYIVVNGNKSAVVNGRTIIFPIPRQ